MEVVLSFTPIHIGKFAVSTFHIQDADAADASA
jgi:hypothetical protein